MWQKNRGFTLVELIAVVILLGIVGTTVSTSLQSSKTFQLQSSRDQVVTAFFSAQQRAMAQANTITLVISSPNQIDVRENGSSISAGGTQYPITLLPSQTITAATFNFDRLGKTSAATLTLSQGSSNVNIGVSATGYVF